MNGKIGTLVALAALTAKVGAPVAALAQDVADLSQQCEYIFDIQDDRNALQRELDLIQGNSPNALTCRFENTTQSREACEEQCVGLLLALLGDDPLGQIPDADPY